MMEMQRSKLMFLCLSILFTVTLSNTPVFAGDRYIPGILETVIGDQVDSKEGRRIIIQTSRHVFGEHGRIILIPKGSRLVCNYELFNEQEITKLAISCEHIVFAGNRKEIKDFEATVFDAQGKALAFNDAGAVAQGTRVQIRPANDWYINLINLNKGDER